MIDLILMNELIKTALASLREGSPSLAIALLLIVLLIPRRQG